MENPLRLGNAPAVFEATFGAPRSVGYYAADLFASRLAETLASAFREAALRNEEALRTFKAYREAVARTPEPRPSRGARKHARRVKAAERRRA